MDWGFNIADIGNGILVVVLSILGALGLRRGVNAGPKPSNVEVAGALVDSMSVDKLTNAIRAHTEEEIARRRSWERMVNNLEDIHNQLQELRLTLQRLGDIMIQRK